MCRRWIDGNLWNLLNQDEYFTMNKILVTWQDEELRTYNSGVSYLGLEDEAQ